MFGIRQKLSLGFGGLLAILLLVGGLSVALLGRYSGTLERVFRENYDSVLYAQNMRHAVEGLDDMAQAKLWGENVNVSTNVDALVSNFELNLKSEEGNLTLPDEGQLAKSIHDLWYGVDGSLGYKSQLVDLLAAPSTGNAAPQQYRDRLMPAAGRLKELAQQINDLNVKNMGFTNGQVQRSAVDARRTMYLLVGAGTLLGVAFIILMSRAILRPLNLLTESAMEVERGNLELVLPSQSRDELGRLADAFNSMTSKLRELRRTDRAKLVRTQRTTQLALGSLPDAVAIVSNDGRVELANDVAQKLFGLQPDISLANLTLPALADLYKRATVERRTIQSKGYDGTIQIFNGQERFFLPTAVPILDEERMLVGVTLVLADVTNLRRLDEMKSGMLSVVSHELKTPLTSIRMATHLLLEEKVGQLNAKQQELLIAAREDADRLYDIIENLLDMGRIESGRALIEPKPVSAESLVTESIDDAKAAYREKGVQLRGETSPEVHEVQADPARISHVFSNLLSNALKHTPSGGVVTIDVQPDGDMVRFSVSDNGEGIPAEHLPRIFDRFYRVPGKSVPGGAGLGLAIAKEIVDVHGGTIAVESREGQGTTVSFKLPAASSPAAFASDRGRGA